MGVELVTIVNPNGRKGRVAATSKAAAAYKQPPSDRDESAPAGAPVVEVDPDGGDDAAAPTGRAAKRGGGKPSPDGQSSDEATGSPVTTSSRTSPES
jgi:hypothetical protein